MANDPYIAIVDDDLSMREAVLNLLRSLRFAAVAFASAEEFLGSDALDRASCLVLDVHMPGMGGLRLQEHLAESGRKIPIIFITVYPNDATSAKALGAGAVCVLAKPFSEEDLIEGIRSALKSGEAGHD